MNYHYVRGMLLATIAMAVFAANTATATRSLQGGGASLLISLPVAGTGKTGLHALKCSVLGKFGVSTPFCNVQVRDAHGCCSMSSTIPTAALAAPSIITQGSSCSMHDTTAGSCKHVQQHKW
jgi:hypothetical protein